MSSKPDVVATKQPTGERAVVPGAVPAKKERRSKQPAPSSTSTIPKATNDTVATKQPTGERAVVPGAVPAMKERRSKQPAPSSNTKASNSMVATKQPTGERAVVPGAVPAMKERRSKQPAPSSTSSPVPKATNDTVATKRPTGERAVVPGAVPAMKERRSKQPAPSSTSSSVHKANEGLKATKQPTGERAVVPGAVPAVKERRSKQPLSTASSSNSEGAASEATKHTIGETAAKPGAVAATKERRSKISPASATAKDGPSNTKKDEKGFGTPSNKQSNLADDVYEVEPEDEVIAVTGNDVISPTSISMYPTDEKQTFVAAAADIHDSEVLYKPESFTKPESIVFEGDRSLKMKDLYDIPDEELAVAVEVIDDEEIVDAEEIDLDKQKEKMKKYKIIAGVVIVVVVVIVAVLAYFLTQDEATDTSTPSPTASPTSSRRVQNKAVLEENVSQASALDDMSSAEYKAFHWISEEDKSGVQSTDQNFLQRYVLAELFYATGGENWGTDCYPNYTSACNEVDFLDVANECKWHGVICDDSGAVTELHVG